MERCHHMPFGAQVLDDGRVRFRVWAPALHSPAVRLGSGTVLPMDPLGDGWHACETADAPPGTLYYLLVDDAARVPDPASRFQPEGVGGPSEVVDPRAYAWHDGAWCGRPWEEAVIQELHVGAFDPRGDFDGVRRRLDHLAGIGVTALELMPVAEGPGRRSWGYDAVLPFAPRHGYGRPETLKRLIDAAHARGLMVFLDVVCNHFGPQGNELPRYAPAFLTERYHTPWGAAINFDGEDSGPVRRFFIDNALYWLDEYHFDGLRIDAVHAIFDRSEPHFLVELAEAVHAGPGASRHVHLVLENDANEARYLARRTDGQSRYYAAQWNDDLHHAVHVLLTDEQHGYYADYIDDPLGHLLRCLEQGFAWQGEPSPFRGGRRRGESSRGLPPAAFVGFLQNHDQIGNRAAGERMARLAPAEAVRAATSLLLLAPFPPLLFMGQEWGTEQPFPFFCDFEGKLADAVREGRRREFPDLAAAEIPDPCAPETFALAVLDWAVTETASAKEWLALHRELLRLRHEIVVPRLRGLRPLADGFARIGDTSFTATWSDGEVQLTVLANLGATPVDRVPRPRGDCLHALPAPPGSAETDTLAPWSVAWYLAQSGDPGVDR